MGSSKDWRAETGGGECSSGGGGCEMLSGTWSANMRADHVLVYGRTIAGRKRGRRFKAAGANETQRVRAGCFVRGLSCARRLGFGAKAELGEKAGLWTGFNKLQLSRILVS